MVSDKVKAVRDALSSLSDEDLDKLDNITKLHSQAEAALEQVKEAREAEEKKLRELLEKSDRVKRSEQSRIDQIKNQAAEQAKMSNDLIAAAKKNLADLQSQINSKRQEHDQIIASFESLRKRLA